MKSFEQIAEVIDAGVCGQLEVLAMLETHGCGPDHLKNLLLSLRQLQRLTELTSISLLRELEQRSGFHPNSRNSRNKMIYAGRFSRGELRDLTRLSAELFDAPAALTHPDGKQATMPATRSGMAAGAFGVASAMEIARVLDQVPANTPAETLAWVEGTLAEIATQLAPEDLRKAGLKILQGLNADDEPADAERQRKRDATLSGQGANLMSGLKVTATPELDALLRRLFADYGGPGDLLPTGEKDADTRTAGQRRHDALVAALAHALHRNGPMPPTRGCSTVVATMTMEQLRAAAGIVPSDVGTMLPVRDLLRLGADKNAFLAILDDDTGNLIELGRSKRAADVYAYLGLVAAQGGDMTPGSGPTSSTVRNASSNSVALRRQNQWRELDAGRPPHPPQHRR
ncbi:DUF222 domain-containing protein [Corynebacterium sp. H127]|uniref:DUF222 domain-containing protein n=1 Tax=Corynebacterium sp. H127 TaxID=3133418 RepID=UPI0030AA9EC4